MKKNAMRFSVTVLAALTLAGGGLSTAHAADGDWKSGHGDRKIVVKGDHNQIVTGDNNVVGRGEVESSGHGEVPEFGNGAEASAPAYATVRSNVSALIEREHPTTVPPSREVGRFPAGAKIPVACYVTNGQSIYGNTTWYKVREGNGIEAGYVAAYYTTGLSAYAPKC